MTHFAPSRTWFGSNSCRYNETFHNMFKVNPNFEFAGAGTGGLGLAIEGPSEAKMACKDNRDGSCSVEYLPTEAGEYDVSIKFSNQHIPGSPFKVTCLFIRFLWITI